MKRFNDGKICSHRCVILGSVWESGARTGRRGQQIMRRPSGSDILTASTCTHKHWPRDGLWRLGPAVTVRSDSPLLAADVSSLFFSPLIGTKKFSGDSGIAHAPFLKVPPVLRWRCPRKFTSVCSYLRHAPSVGSVARGYQLASDVEKTLLMARWMRGGQVFHIGPILVYVRIRLI